MVLAARFAKRIVNFRWQAAGDGGGRGAEIGWMDRPNRVHVNKRTAAESGERQLIELTDSHKSSSQTAPLAPITTRCKSDGLSSKFLSLDVFTAHIEAEIIRNL